MSVVKKIGSEYNIEIKENLIEGSYKPNLDQTLDPIGNASNKSFTATVRVVITKQIAAYMRGLCSTQLDLGVSLGNQASTVSMLHGLLSSPIPIAPAYGKGEIPELSESELSNMATNIASVPSQLEISFSANITNGAYYSIIFMPDARGFNIELVDMSREVSLKRDHPFVISTAFVIDELEDSICNDGPGSKITKEDFNDAKIYKFTKKVNVSMSETLTSEIIRIDIGLNRQNIINAYYKLLNEIFWRGNSISAKRTKLRPYVDHLFGVDNSGMALQVIKLKGLSSYDDPYHVNVNIKGEAETTFIYGDIRYPGNPQISATKPKFDIISNSDEWTEYGPTTVKYIGGEEAGNIPSTIFSWEGRTSSLPKILSKTAAQLQDFN